MKPIEINSSIISMMAVPLGNYKYPLKIENDTLDFIKNLEQKRNFNNVLSASNRVLENEKLENIRSFIDFCTNDFFKKVYVPLNDAKLRITDSWFNYSFSGQNHHMHNHPNSILSGVFYVDVNENDSISFFNVNLDRTIKIETEKFNEYNYDTYVLNIENNRLVLFPSYVWHYTLPNMYNKTRISLSFNTFISGVIDKSDGLTSLTI